MVIVKEVLTTLKERMPERRYNHILGVIETAKKLSERYQVSIEKAEIAAVFHDVLKFADYDYLKSILKLANADSQLSSFHHELWHAPAGAYVAKTEYGIEDQDILNAITYHTTGRANMSDLEKIIYIADMIEPNRTFSGVEFLREKAFEDLGDGMFECIRHSISFLIDKSAEIYPDTLYCYNHLVEERKSE